MKTASYPALGSKVSFVRLAFPEKQIVTGEGIVIAILLDALKRPVVQLEQTSGDGQRSAFNVDLNCLNPSVEQVEGFKAAMERVQSLEAEGNAESARVVAEYNQRITVAYSGFLGEPVTFDV